VSPEWWSYRPQDLLLFSPEVYWRLFELQNAALAPLPIVLPLALALAVALHLRARGRPARLVWPLLAAAWALVGWSFVGGRYAAINWAADDAAWAFHLEAAALATAGLAGGLDGGRLRGLRGAAGAALAVWALALHPLSPLAFGRPLAQAEVAGLAPDPTAMLTLGLLLIVRRRPLTLLLAVVPALQLAASAATLHLLGAPERVAPAAALLVSLAAETAAALLARRKPGSRR
jgi:hypothetical protein